jgi:glycosyltransferase involved in cell wall biosynthesis
MNKTDRYAATMSTSKCDLATSSLSLIIPAYNDETTITQLIKDADCLLKERCQDYEIICVNDGSKDNTLQVLRALEASVPALKVSARIVPASG